MKKTQLATAATVLALVITILVFSFSSGYVSGERNWLGQRFERFEDGPQTQATIDELQNDLSARAIHPGGIGQVVTVLSAISGAVVGGLVYFGFRGTCRPGTP